MVKWLAAAATVAVTLPLGLVLLIFANPTASQASLSLRDGPSVLALKDIPPAYLALYMGAAQACPGLPWGVLAGIGKVESDHGQSTAPGVHSGANYAGAEGPMQFEPGTFAEYATPVPPGGANPSSPYDPADAIYAAARDLCANGAEDMVDLHRAIFNYNHAEWYVDDVLLIAGSYAREAAPERASTAQ